MEHIQQNKESKIHCLTFLVNDTHHAEYNDRNKYSSKDWYHGYFIIDDRVIIYYGLICFFFIGRCCSVIPCDNLHVYCFRSFLNMSCCVWTVERNMNSTTLFYRSYIVLYNWSFEEHSLILLGILK